MSDVIHDVITIETHTNPFYCFLHSILLSYTVGLLRKDFELPVPPHDFNFRAIIGQNCVVLILVYLLHSGVQVKLTGCGIIGGQVAVSGFRKTAINSGFSNKCVLCLVAVRYLI